MRGTGNLEVRALPPALPVLMGLALAGCQSADPLEAAASSAQYGAAARARSSASPKSQTSEREEAHPAKQGPTPVHPPSTQTSAEGEVRRALLEAYWQHSQNNASLRETLHNLLYTIRSSNEDDRYALDIELLPRTASSAEADGSSAAGNRAEDAGAAENASEEDPTPLPWLTAWRSTYPVVDAGSYGEIKVRSKTDAQGNPRASFAAQDCSVAVSVASSMTLDDDGQPVYTYTPMSTGLVWSKWARSFNQATDHEPDECDGDSEADTLYLGTLADPADVILCQCPLTGVDNDGNPAYECNTNTTSSLPSYFNFRIALFNIQTRYRLDVTCGGYSGYVELTAWDYACGETTDTAEGDSETGDESIFAQYYYDADHDGYYLTGSAPTVDPDDPASAANPLYFGSFCSRTPIVLPTADGGRLAVSGLSGDSDDGDHADSPSSIRPTTTPPALSTPGDASARSAGADAISAGVELAVTESFLTGRSDLENTGDAMVGGFDLNGDGYADLASGAPYAAPCLDPLDAPDTCQTMSDAGSVTIVLGGPSPFAGEQPLDAANLGLPIPRRLRVDNVDLDENSHPVDVTVDDGLVYQQTSQAPGAIVLTGAVEGLEAGHALAAGDFNADGWPDLVIGQPAHAHRSGEVDVAGRVILLLSRPGIDLPTGELTLDATALQEAGFEVLEIVSSHEAGQFGASLAAGADLDGDALPELVVGAPTEPGQDSTSGRIYVFSGATLGSLAATGSALPQDAEQAAAVILKATAATGQLGYQVALLEHFLGATAQNRAVADLAAGVSSFTTSLGNVGQVLVWKGRSPLSDLAGSSGPAAADFTLLGDQPYALDGAKLASSPDLDADGRSELLVGAPSQDSNGIDHAGAVYFVFSTPDPSSPGSGRSGTLTLPINADASESANVRRMAGTSNMEQLGQSIDARAVPAATVGSAPGETWLVLGDPGYGRTSFSLAWGRAIVLFQAAGQVWRGGDGFPWEASSGFDARWFVAESADAAGLGQRVAILGDVDQDDETQAPELLLGAQSSLITDTTSSTGQGPGLVYLYWGVRAY